MTSMVDPFTKPKYIPQSLNNSKLQKKSAHECKSCTVKRKMNSVSNRLTRIKKISSFEKTSYSGIVFTKQVVSYNVQEDI